MSDKNVLRLLSKHFEHVYLAKIFGASSKRSSNQDSDQISLFNEAEMYDNADMADPELTEIKMNYRKSKNRSTKDKLLEDIEVEIVEHRINEDNDRSCSKCPQHIVRIYQC